MTDPTQIPGVTPDPAAATSTPDTTPDPAATTSTPDPSAGGDANSSSPLAASSSPDSSSTSPTPSDTAPAASDAPAAASPAASTAGPTSWATTPADPAVTESTPDAAAPATGSSTPSPSSTSGDSPDDDDLLLREFRQMKARLAELEEKTERGQLSLQKTDEELEAKIDEVRADFAEWPKRGGMGDDVAQPWDLEAHGLPAPGKTRDYLPAGEPDQISPIVVAHNKPLLTTGMAGTEVEYLAGLLKKIGYDTSISRGVNHAFSFDDSVASAVASFKRDFHVLEDPSQFPPQSDMHNTTVGPWIWEAVIRAAQLVEKAV